jgi:hypothetical protein
MDSALIAVYRRTNYRVRLAHGGFASIRVDEALPDSLRKLIGLHSWVFITAWNPYSQPTPRDLNRAAQQRLLTALRKLPSTQLICTAVGVGDSWREPSLFAVGPTLAESDALAQQFHQNAYVHGLGDGHARLRLTSGEPPRGQAG